MGMYQVEKISDKATLHRNVVPGGCVCVCVFIVINLQTTYLIFFSHFKYYLSSASKLPPEVAVQIILSKEQLLSKS